MDYSHGTARLNVEVEVDRLSMLPDDIIHQILSLISIKHAVQTSALSSRWRFIWTSMPYLCFSTDDFRTFHEFSEFVNHYLSRRNNQTEVYSIKLTFHEKFRSDHAFSAALLKLTLDYAFSHNIQQLTVTCLLKKKIDLPLDLFRSSSLKYLRLTGCSISFFDPYSMILASIWDLPALTTLHLDYVAFHEDSIFSKCSNLQNLTLSNFRILKSDTFTLFHPQISDLTLKDWHWNLESVNVVAPELKNLTLSSNYRRGFITVNTPNLASLIFNGSRSLQFSTDLPYLETVDICIYSTLSTYSWSGWIIDTLFQQLNNVKSLTFNLEFIEPLISDLEEISHQPSPFCNLKSLKIYPLYVREDDESHKKVNLTSKVLNYLLDGSPSVTFTLISYEEIKKKQQKAQAIENAFKAQKLMTNLQKLLENEKVDIKTNRTRMRRMDHRRDETETSTDEEESDTNDQIKTLVENMQLQLKKKMTHMKTCWEDVGARINQGKKRTRFIISQLREIEVLLLKDLPALKRDELQSRFSSLCAEVDTFVKETIHHMMIPQIELSDCFNELATLSLSSF